MDDETLNHNVFASDLARWLKTCGYKRRLTWENITFNCGDGADAYSCRPDVFSIVPALDPQRTQPWTCEVKRCLADISWPRNCRMRRTPS